jgi:hypothetical protein
MPWQTYFPDEICWPRFVSFLLRLAHDKSVDLPSDAAESLLMRQVEQLANQIIKTKDDTTLADLKQRAAAVV